MASSKQLLVVLMLAFANAKLIIGSPVDDTIDDDDDSFNYNIEDNTEQDDTNSDVVEGGMEAIIHENQDEDLKESDEENDSDSSSDNDQSEDTTSFKSLESDHDGVGLMSGIINNGNGFSISSSQDDQYTNKVTIDGLKIHAEISGMTSTSTTTLDHRTLIGDDNKMIFSDESGELVVVSEGSKCNKLTYEDKLQVSNETLSASDCEEVLKKIEQMKKDREEFEREMQQTMADTFYPGFPFALRPESTADNGYSGSNGIIENINNNNNGNGMSFNNNNNGNGMFGNGLPFGNLNNLFYSGVFPFGPFGRPFGGNNRRHGNSGRQNGGNGRSRRNHRRQSNQIQPNINGLLQ